MKWTTQNPDGSYRTFDDKEDSIIQEIFMDILGWLSKNDKK